MAKIKAVDQESTVLFANKLERGELKWEEDYKNRYVTQEINRLLKKHKVQKQELYRRIEHSENTMKAYEKDLYERDEEGHIKLDKEGRASRNHKARHISVNIVFSVGMALGLDRAEFNILLESAGYAPMKPYRTWRGDDIFLKYYQQIRQCFSLDKNGAEERFDEEAFEKIKREIDEEFKKRDIETPFRGY